jgi:hypothetical protein
MLQRVKPEGHEIGGVREADDAEYAAFLAQLVVVERVGGGHDAGQGQGQAPNPLMSLGPLLRAWRASVTKLSRMERPCGAWVTLGHPSVTGAWLMRMCAVRGRGRAFKASSPRGSFIEANN